MTTPTGTITMADIQTEFGGSNPIALNEYYAGGAYVPAGLAGVPSSGTISMNNLRGKTKTTPVSIDISPTTVVEGSAFFVSVFDSGTIYPTLYWKLTNYDNLQDADFNTVSGSISYDFNEGTGYPVFSFATATDSSFEGLGTFKITFYSDAARTTSVGSSETVSLVDNYSAIMVAPSISTIYRYANKIPGYRASVVSMNTTGLVGATVYYEVYTNSGTLTSADVDAPVALTGTLTVAANGTVSLTVRSTEWDGSNSISTDKTLYVRYKLNNSTGAILGTSSAITLKAMPLVSFSFSPTTIREGQGTTITGALTNVPYAGGGGASLYWSQTGLTTAADWIKSDGTAGTLTGELIFTQQTMQFTWFAKLDSLTESDETLRLDWRLNSSTGTAIWDHLLTIQSPAQITTATAGYDEVQITDISSYPVSRTFTLRVTMDTSLNTASNLVVDADQTSSVAVIPFSYVATEGTAGTYNMKYEIVNANYTTYTISNFPETFIFPVYGVEFFFTGTNTSGVARTLIARITSVPSLGYARNFSVQFRSKAAGDPDYGAWGPIPGNVVINVPLNSTSSVNTTLFSTPSSAAQYDFEFQLFRGGHETKTSPEFLNIWL